MTTRLDLPTSRAIVRQTAERDHRTGKPLLVRLELGGHLVRVKVKGERRWYTVTVSQLWMLGAKNRAAEIRQQKAEARAARRTLRKGR
jgi:hypothetical protein